MLRLITGLKAKLSVKLKLPARRLSWVLAALSWALVSALAVFITFGMRDRARLIRDNDNERLLSMIFAGFWDQNDSASVIEANPQLKERLAGFAIYGSDLQPVDSWGEAPERFDEAKLTGADSDNNESGVTRRWTKPGKRGRVTFVMRTGRMVMFHTSSGSPPPASSSILPPPPPEPRERVVRRPGQQRQNQGAQTLRRSVYLYLDIYHAAYWRAMYGTAAGFILVELGLFVLAFYTRALYIRNAEYRARIEAQKSLVALGTAASTLAHEIKNPLLSIRLQTGILEKSLGGKGEEELTLINEEIDRLSALVYRVNDYLRDPRGAPESINIYNMLNEISLRLCGRSIMAEFAALDALVFIDSGRATSIFENLIRNALESGGAAEEIQAMVQRTGQGRVTITILDRGRGISPENLPRVFEPFFTNKSAGTGIGLSISRRFIEAAGGGITLENRADGGVKAEVFLPGPAGAV